MLLSVQFLSKIGVELHRDHLENLGVDTPLPTWLGNYVSSQQRLLEDKVSRMQLDLSESQKQLNPLRLIQSCLYSTGVRLESSMKCMFSDLSWEVVDLTKRGEPIDFVIQKAGMGQLQVALTGTAGYIGSDSKKFAQLFGAIPLINPGDRLVFLVNPLAMEDPSTRAIERCITAEAIKRLSNNDVCILFVHDFYRMWVKYKEAKLTSDQIFKSVYETAGLFLDENLGA